MLPVIPPPIFVCRRSPTELEIERRNRIRVSLWAFAYEIENTSMVPDRVFDQIARQIRPEMETGHPIMDAFFRTEFSPDTGQWVWRHPELDKLSAKYDLLMEYENEKG